MGSSKEGGGRVLVRGGGAGRWRGEGSRGQGLGRGGVGHGAFFVFLVAFALFLNCRKGKNTGFLWGRGGGAGAILPEMAG